MNGRFEAYHAFHQVVVVGLGGTGSQLARSLARIVYDMGRRGLHTPRLTFIDPDVVDQTNVGRQMFTPADVGQPKAALLARRLSLALGLDITAIPDPFDPATHPNGAATLLLGCVDNHQARRALAQADGFWLDCGNHHHSGQVVAGNCGDPERVLRSARQMPEHEGVTSCLPHAGLVFPELLEPEAGPQPDPQASCAELVEAGSQHLLVNDMMAAVAAGYVHALLHRQPLYSFLSFVSLEAVRPIAITRESIEAYVHLS